MCKIFSEKMDPRFLQRLFSLVSSAEILFLLLLPLTFIILKNITRSCSKSKYLPPGPKPWPIIGNLLHMGNQPHASLAEIAKIHGPLISLRLGTQLLVVGSSAKAATEILKTQDRFLSARHVPQVIPRESHVLRRVALVWCPESIDTWKLLRGLCRTELFSAKAIESNATLREKKVGELMDFLVAREGKVVSIGEVVFSTVFNTISNLLFSNDLAGLEEKGMSSGLKSHVRKLMLLIAAPNIADFYPIFAGLDPQGLRRKLSKLVEETFAIWAINIKERRNSYVHDSPKRDFLDVFLANGFDDDQINWLASELFSAGTDTTATTIEWAVAEILKNKEVMEKVEEELEREITKNTISESDVSELPYLNACIKETLRLHPPVPLLVPHRATETCEVMKYTVPKDSQVLVNVWAISRDPSTWEDPLSFKPDRFLGSNVDFKGGNYEFLPFGAGRRICPGVPMANKLLPLILASLIRCFDWSLPNGEDLARLDMKDKFGLVLQKEQPLLLVPKRRL